MTPRVTSSVLVGALVRKAEAEGGFAAVLAKGDSSAGSVIVILTQRGANPQIFERLLGPDGLYSWEQSNQLYDNYNKVPEFIARRRHFDPDLWVLELDIPSQERFAAEMNSFA